MSEIHVVGDGPCGKTSLISSFMKFDMYQNDDMCKYPFPFGVMINGKKENLMLKDTTGASNFHFLTLEQCRHASAMVICFSVDKRDKFENVRTFWVPEILKRRPSVPYILVGTKVDLRSDAETKEDLQKMSQNFVTKKEGKTMAKKIKAKAYIECSALKKEDATNVFNKVFRIIGVELPVETLDSSEKTIDTRDKKCTVF